MYICHIKRVDREVVGTKEKMEAFELNNSNLTCRAIHSGGKH